MNALAAYLAPGERTKRIRGFRDYAVTSDGRVFSLKRGEVRELKSDVGITNQPRVTLCDRGRQKRFEVSHLVAETFLGPRPRGAWVIHRDGDGSNNRVGNLFYGRRRDERALAVAIPTVSHGVARPLAKLTPAKVGRIRRLITAGVSQRAIGKLYGVSKTAIGQIVRGISWIRVGQTGRATEPTVSGRSTRFSRSRGTMPAKSSRRAQGAT